MDLHLMAGRPRRIVGLAAGIFLFEASTQLFLRSNHAAAEHLLAYIFLINVAALMAIEIWRARRSDHLKAHWFLLSAVSGLYIVYVLWDLWAGAIFPRVPVAYLISCQFVIAVSSAIPSVLLISLPAGRRYFRHLIWIDLALVAMAAYLFYVVVLHQLPFTSAPVAPIDEMAFMHLLFLESLCVTAAYLLHYFAAVGRDEKWFFGAVSLNAVISLPIRLVFNRLVALHPQESLYNVAGLLVSLLAPTIYLLLPAEDSEAAPFRVGVLADLINIASPAMPSAALLTLGIVVESRFHRIGIAAMTTAFLLFAVRATFFQRSFERAQLFLEQAQMRLREMSYVDALTGIANRRAFNEALDSEWEHSMRSGSPLSLILIDIDLFKQLNDTLGHQEGDGCLVSVAQALRAVLLRKTDILGRYGGDEFAAVLPSTNLKDAEVVAQRLWEAVHILGIEIPGPTVRKISVSVGVGSCTEFHHQTVKDLISAADKALYSAKSAGRDCWRTSDPYL
ncbi:GGDEF domain-containing protein [Acidicapsa ligni]|uniref:GGDEF domain-containing protein n=1 Tax=Acidicapsa ligni TaxID=542300 RepID=UPI0021DF9A7D|nr:diguanylate cyclase [Acidicapsa ligni]